MLCGAGTARDTHQRSFRDASLQKIDSLGSASPRVQTGATSDEFHSKIRNEWPVCNLKYMHNILKMSSEHHNDCNFLFLGNLGSH